MLFTMWYKSFIQIYILYQGHIENHLKGFLKGKIKHERCDTWVFYVKEHNLTLQHVQGMENKAADVLYCLLHNQEMTTKQTNFHFSSSSKNE